MFNKWTKDLITYGLLLVPRFRVQTQKLHWKHLCGSIHIEFSVYLYVPVFCLIVSGIVFIFVASFLHVMYYGVIGKCGLSPLQVFTM